MVVWLTNSDCRSDHLNGRVGASRSVAILGESRSSRGPRIYTQDQPWTTCFHPQTTRYFVKCEHQKSSPPPPITCDFSVILVHGSPETDVHEALKCRSHYHLLERRAKRSRPRLRASIPALCHPLPHGFTTPLSPPLPTAISITTPPFRMPANSPHTHILSHSHLCQSSERQLSTPIPICSLVMD